MRSKMITKEDKILICLMMPLIVDCEPVLTLNADTLNITNAYKLMRILCRYFNGFMKKISPLM